MDYLIKYVTPISTWYIDDDFNIWKNGCKIDSRPTTLDGAKDRVNELFKEALYASIVEKTEELDKLKALPSDITQFRNKV